jgi:mannose-6-phosphate isomerase-like protein (cupin superfamily)
VIIVHAEQVPAFRANDETTLRELLPTATNDLPYSLAHADLEPGEFSIPHRLLSSTEIYILVSGQGVMHIDDETANVGPGDIVRIPPSATQSIQNTGSGPLTFYCIVSPPWRSEDDIR